MKKDFKRNCNPSVIKNYHLAGIKKPPKIGGAVPGTGIEPAHPCERQILSLLRLPIPPPGLQSFLRAEAKPLCFSSGCNIKSSNYSSQNPV